MAFQKADPITNVKPYRTAVQTVATIARQEGVLSLWAGFSPYYLRCGGHTVAMFGAFLPIVVQFLRSLPSDMEEAARVDGARTCLPADAPTAEEGQQRGDHIEISGWADWEEHSRCCRFLSGLRPDGLLHLAAARA
jgi:hypothetical protein